MEARRSSILVQAYSFTSAPIAEALAAAQRRGVRVEVILDQAKTAEEKHSKADFLARSGVPVRMDARHGSAHNKVLILDNQTVITGSYNFTRHSEEDNAENLLIIRDKSLAAKYTANWKAQCRTLYGLYRERAEMSGDARTHPHPSLPHSSAKRFIDESQMAV